MGPRENIKVAVIGCFTSEEKTTTTSITEKMISTKTEGTETVHTLSSITTAPIVCDKINGMENPGVNQ